MLRQILMGASLLMLPTAAGALSVGHAGFLLDAQDLPLSGTSALSFRLYAQQAGGSAVWESGSCQLDVRGGRYATTLGDTCGASITETAWPASDTRYLEVQVGPTILSPRVRMGAVPTALLAGRALTSDHASTADQATNADRLGGADRAAFWERTSDLASAKVGTGTLGALLAELQGRPTTVSVASPLTGNGTAAAPIGLSVGTSTGTVAAGDDARFGQWSGAMAPGFNASTARTALGLGTAATTDASAFATAAQGIAAASALSKTGGTATGTLTLSPSSGDALVTTAGKVGIGTTTPAQQLDVQGDVEIGTGNALLGSSATDNFYIRTAGQMPNPNFSIGIGNGSGGWSNQPILWNGFLALQKDGGNVGIGTTSPSEKLEISGNLKVNGWISGDRAPGEYTEEFTDDHCTAYDQAGYLHIRTNINASGAWSPKLLEVKGFHSYGGEYTHDFLAVVNTTDGGSFNVNLRRNSGNTTPVIYRTNANFGGARRVAFAVPKVGCCCVGRIWVKIYHGSGGKDTTATWAKMGTNDTNPAW